MDEILYDSIIREMAQQADKTLMIEDIRIYTNWVMVKTDRWSLSTIFRGMPGLSDPPGMNSWMGNWLSKPALESALELLSSRITLHRAVGMACLKSLLPIPKSLLSGDAMTQVQSIASKVPTCFVGYFKKAAEWRDMGWPVSIVELFPRPGDIHWDDADEVLNSAQVVLMSGLTLVNGTFPSVIQRTPSAKIRIMMGPTVPPSPVLFRYGIDLLGVTLIHNVDKMVRYAELGGGSIAYSPPDALNRLNIIDGKAGFMEKLVMFQESMR